MAAAAHPVHGIHERAKMKSKIVVSQDGVAKLRKMAANFFARYVADRKSGGGASGIDESYQVAEWMYKCGTARGRYDNERRKWVPRYVDGKSNIGSLVFHRQVNTLAGMLGAVLYGAEHPWEYADLRVVNSDVASETGLAFANHMNAMSSFIYRLDSLQMKLVEFCVSIFKLSNVFAIVGLNRKRRREVRFEVSVKPLNKLDENFNWEYDIKKRPVVHEGLEIPYPSVHFPYPANVYLDRYVANMQDQQCVIVLTPTTKAAIMAEADSFDTETLASVDWKELQWNGEYGMSSEEESAPSESGSVLRWDVYIRALVDENGDVSEEGGKDVLLWMTLIGNEAENAVCLRCVKDFDPDGEIPIQPIRAVADNPDMMYHTFLSDVLRPYYAARCAIANALIDHDAVMMDPPRTVLRGMHSIKDWTYRHGQLWNVDTHDAIRFHNPPGNPLLSMQLANMIEDDMKQALATDPSKMGEYAGSRTTAVEIMRVTAATDATVALRNSYILEQLLPWIAKKHVSYCRAFMPAEVIQMILGEAMFPSPVPKYIGEYDVVVNIVTRHMEDQTRKMIGRELLSVLASNPMLLKSDTHKIDVGELVRSVVRDAKFPVEKIVKTTSVETESEANARNKIMLMLHTGVYLPPNENEDLETHARVARTEVVRWRGISESDDPRAANVGLIEQYEKDCMRMKANAERQAVRPVPVGGGEPNVPPQVVEGMTGNEGVELGRFLAGEMAGGPT